MTRQKNENPERSAYFVAGDKLKTTGIKVCRVATVSYYLVSQLKTQAEFLRDSGMKVVLISSDGPELSELNLNAKLIHEVIDIPRSIKPWKDIVAFIKLMKTYRKHNFDIIHSTTPKAGLLTAVAAFILGTPVRLHTWTGQQWVTLKGPIRWLSRFSDKIIGCLNTCCYTDSKSQRQFLLKEKIIVPQKLHLIGQGSLAGVDLRRFDSNRWPESEKVALKNTLSIGTNSKVLTFVGRISRDKGIIELVSAFKKLIRHGYNVDLLIIGPRDQDCGGNIDFAFPKIDQSQRIHYLGYTKCPERYLAISDIFCLPSYREGFGTVVIEAAAMGVPTVGTKINGLIDAVDNGKTGILVSVRDEKSLFNAFRKLLDDPELSIKMGNSARERCVKKYDSNIVNKLLVGEYLQLLNNVSKKKSHRV